MTAEPAIPIQGHERTVSELLKDKKYTIDYFQREYRWQKDHVTELVEDLTDKFLSYYDPKHELKQVANYGNYFLGSIIIGRKSGQNFIIDGQQRLTSLTLLLIYLNHLQKSRSKQVNVCDLIFSEWLGERSFNLQIEERAACMKALFDGQPFDVAGQPESIRNLLARYTDIEENFPDDLTGDALPYFIWWLMAKVVLVEITAFSDDDAYTIFETMNDRGLSLTQAEMLKGYLLSNVEGAEDKESLNKLWREQLRQLMDIDKEEELDFFKNWLRAKYAKEIRERKKGATNKDFEETGTAFHKWIRDKHASIGLVKSADYRDFIQRQFATFSKHYVRIREAALQFKPEFECIYFNASNYFTLQYPLLLAPLRLEDDPDTIDRKIRLVSHYIDIFIARRVWNFRTLGYSAIQYTMFNLIRQIRDRSLPELVQILRQELDSMPDTFATEDRFRMHQQNRYYVHRLLARITYHVERQSCLPGTSYVTYTDWTLRTPFQVEHIWAEKPERHRDEFGHDQDFLEYRNRIGGLLLLPSNFNAGLKDDSYESKLEHYFGQNLLAKSLHPKCYEKNSRFVEYVERSGLPFRPHPQFKKADLDARQDLYQQICEQIWSPSRFDEELK